jgi:ribosome biogenesis protein MAK21
MLSSTSTTSSSKPKSKKKSGDEPVDELQTTYDPHKRDPLHAHASSSPLWELTPLLSHYHPTISLHAAQLLRGETLTATPDLSLNTLNHFLDRFVYKNPKKLNKDKDGDGDNDNAMNIGSGAIRKAKGSSLMQPAASAMDRTGVKLVKGEVSEELGGRRYEEGYWKRKGESEVKPDEVFFHRFFSGKKGRMGEEADAGEEERGGDNDEGDESDEDESGDDEMDLTGDEAAREGKEGHADDDEEDSESDAEEDEIWEVGISPGFC